MSTKAKYHQKQINVNTHKCQHTKFQQTRNANKPNTRKHKCQQTKLQQTQMSNINKMPNISQILNINRKSNAKHNKTVKHKSNTQHNTNANHKSNAKRNTNANQTLMPNTKPDVKHKPNAKYKIKCQTQNKWHTLTECGSDTIEFCTTHVRMHHACGDTFSCAHLNMSFL